MGSKHKWVPPRGPIRWEHCRICGIIKRADGKNGPCKGPVKIEPRVRRESSGSNG